MNLFRDMLDMIIINSILIAFLFEGSNFIDTIFRAYDIDTIFSVLPSQYRIKLQINLERSSCRHTKPKITAKSRLYSIIMLHLGILMQLNAVTKVLHCIIKS